jgi:hypothetical protein
MVLRPAVPAVLCALFLLIGCGSSGPGTPTQTQIGSSKASGSVHGGQQPVVGASIQLYTVGTTADGSAATPLLTSTVTSGPDGTFTITGLYSCTNATQVYIVATGGNPGLSTTNPNIALMAALGPCSSLTSTTFININELTTVAAVAALAPFMTSATAIGSSAADAASLANAFTLAGEYVNTTTGTAPGDNVPSGYTVPTTLLNTLADIISACINSTGGVAGDGSLCGQLFTLTTVSPNPAPTNTIQAMLNLAYNPTLNTSALYALTPPTPPFQPTLTSAPGNFLVSLQGASTIEASQSAINFQDVTVGSASPIQTITFQNFSNMTGITIVGPNSSDFPVGNFSSSYVGNCGYAGNYPDPCWIQVYAFPSAAGVRNASIAISYNNGNSTLYIPLSVTGIASTPNPSLSSSLVNFPPTITGTSSNPVAVTLSNSGSGTVTVSGVTIDGATSNNFTQTNNCSSVAVNANCTIYITFTPTATGAQSATLQVTSTATGSNTVSLSGAGISAGDPAALWPGSLTFTIWGANEDIVLTNGGTSLGVATTGGLSSDHSYSATNNCASSAVSCTFMIANTPNDPLSTYTDSYFPNVTGEAYVADTSLISTIASTSAAYLYLGTGGVNENGIGGTMTFPQEQVGVSETATIQLANTGTGSPAAALAIGGANPGDFSVSAVQPTISSTPSSFCPAATTGTQPCTITVTFTPTAAGTRSAKISLDPNGSSTGQYIYVTGTALGPGPSFSVQPYVAGSILVSELPSNIDPHSVGAQTLVATNTGTTTLSLAATLSGANASLFTVDTSQCQSLAPQATCWLNATFLGAAVGTYNATLLVSDTNSSGSYTTTLTGETSYWDPLPNIFNTSFGNQEINTTSAARSFTVTDDDGYALADPITLSLPANSNFTLPSGTSCPAGQICTFSIAFAPHATGSISEVLTATDTVTGASSYTTFTGTGTQ